VPQRFNSALGLSPHLHALVTDGVWVRHSFDASPVFRSLRKPTKAELSAVAWACCERTVKRLKKRGLWLDSDPLDDRFAQDEPLIACLAQASIAGLLVTGPNAGGRPMRLYGRAARDGSERGKKTPKNAYGFDLDASARAPAKDRKARERLCRYLLRPPLSQDRLARGRGGTFVVSFRRPWEDGTAGIVLSGQELMARLVLLVHPPRIHTVRYYGAWARRSKLRALVTPQPLETTTATEVDLAQEAQEASAHRFKRGYRQRMTWAQALAKVYAIDVTLCPRCQREGLHCIAVLHDSKVIPEIVDTLKRKEHPP